MSDPKILVINSAFGESEARFYDSLEDAFKENEGETLHYLEFYEIKRKIEVDEVLIERKAP